MKKVICAILACLFISLGFVSIGAAADPAPSGTSVDKGNPTNNGWTEK